MKSQSGRPNRSIFPLIMIAAGLLLIAGALVGGLIFIPAPSSASSTATALVPPVQALSATDPIATIPRVDLAKAKEALDSKTAIFVDVRDAGSYAAGHIPGALSIPLADLPNRLNELKKDAWIITYCT
jgi:Tfp pilus assembly protein PilN